MKNSSALQLIYHFFLETANVFRSALPEGFRVELDEVNRQPALITRAGSRAFAVLTMDLVPVGNALRATAAPSSDRDGSIEVEAWQIRTIRVVANPEKLTHV